MPVSSGRRPVSSQVSARPLVAWSCRAPPLEVSRSAAASCIAACAPHGSLDPRASLCATVLLGSSKSAAGVCHGPRQRRPAGHPQPRGRAARRQRHVELFMRTRRAQAKPPPVAA